MRSTLLAFMALPAFACGSTTTPLDGSTDPPFDAAIRNDTGSDDVANDAVAPADSAQDAMGADAGPPAWLDRQTTFSDAQIIVERVAYRSGAYRVNGQVCHPIAAGRHPIVVFNHGGFSGLTDELTSTSSTCRGGARNGYVVVESSYRGEDGSEGPIEVCLGEVDDVLALLSLVRAEPFANPDRVAIVGGSHGGCITLRLVQRGAPAQVAVDFFGPTDWAAAYRFWEQAMVGQAPAVVAVYQSLIDTLRTATGGTPSTAPVEYARRSPLGFSLDLMRSDTALLIAHGTVDPLVPLVQSCNLVSSTGGFLDYHLDGMQHETGAVPAGCESSGLAWINAPRPSMHWPAPRYFIAYDGLGHGFDGAPGTAAIGDYIDYLVTRFPPQ